MIRKPGGRARSSREYCLPAAGIIPTRRPSRFSVVWSRLHDMVEQPAAKRRILILGGGFAGAYAASRLEKHLVHMPGVEILLIAKENFVLFTPMLHEVCLL